MKTGYELKDFVWRRGWIWSCTQKGLQPNEKNLKGMQEVGVIAFMMGPDKDVHLRCRIFECTKYLLHSEEILHRFFFF